MCESCPSGTRGDHDRRRRDLPRRDSSVVVENAFRQIREAADRDPLTGLANRRYLDRMLARYLEQLEQSASPCR